MVMNLLGGLPEGCLSVNPNTKVFSYYQEVRQNGHEFIGFYVLCHARETSMPVKN